ncbi:MAG TPA: hypothetical protein VGN81_01875 [Pseudonocardiaceae bacterium]|jgi:hypothetical protein
MMSFVEVSSRVLAGTKERLRQLVAELPQPLADRVRHAVRRYLDEQVDRDPPRNIVTAIAYDVGVRELDLLVEVGLATALGGMHALVLDDFVDNRGVSARPWHNLYVCHVLYVLHQRSLQRIHPTDWFPHGLDADVAAQLCTYNALVDEELNHVQVATAYESPRIVWEKCAPVKAVIERVLAVAGRRADLPSYAAACDLACFALCTLDDMLDWTDDFRLRRFTYPIQSALSRLGVDWDEDRSDEIRAAVYAELCFGQTYHLLLKEILDSLDQAIDLVERRAPNLAVLVGSSRTAAVESWQAHVGYLLDVERGLAVG